MVMMNRSKIDVAVIVPQREEYKAVAKVFSISTIAAQAALPHGGTYVISKIKTKSSSQPLRLAIACINDMYNYPCLALTERLLLHIKPSFVFLVGSACGNLRKVKICDVVIMTDKVAHLGRGRRMGNEVNPRPHTEPIAQRMKDAITRYTTYRAEDFNRWNRRCRKSLRKICGDSLPSNFNRKDIFEIKTGIIASDDLVLSWSNQDDARNYWAKYVSEEAKAYDMKSAGFSHACAKRTNEPNWTIIRGISDHGIDGEKKYHMAAATIAAEWLKGFITKDEGVFGSKPRGKILKTNLQQIYELLEQEQKKNLFVGKRRFIRVNLCSDYTKIRTLEHAINQAVIKEYEVKNPRKEGHTTTAIRLDKESKFL
jgi:nucleoside phosphorylase